MTHPTVVPFDISKQLFLFDISKQLFLFLGIF